MLALTHQWIDTLLQAHGSTGIHHLSRLSDFKHDAFQQHGARESTL